MLKLPLVIFDFAKIAFLAVFHIAKLMQLTNASRGIRSKPIKLDLATPPQNILPSRVKICERLLNNWVKANFFCGWHYGVK